MVGRMAGWQDGWRDGWQDGRMDGGTDGRMAAWKGSRTDGRMGDRCDWDVFLSSFFPGPRFELSGSQGLSGFLRLGSDRSLFKKRLFAKDGPWYQSEIVRGVLVFMVPAGEHDREPSPVIPD